MDAFERLVAESALVILHAGAGSVIQAIHAGKFPLVMPRRADLGEHVDDHQLEFAQELSDLGKVVLATNAREMRQGIGRALELQRTGEGQTSLSPLVLLLRERLQSYAKEPVLA